MSPTVEEKYQFLLTSLYASGSGFLFTDIKDTTDPDTEPNIDDFDQCIIRAMKEKS